MSKTKKHLMDLLGEDVDLTDPEMIKAVDVLEKEREDGDNEG